MTLSFMRSEHMHDEDTFVAVLDGDLGRATGGLSLEDDGVWRFHSYGHRSWTEDMLRQTADKLGELNQKERETS